MTENFDQNKQIHHRMRRMERFHSSSLLNASNPNKVNDENCFHEKKIRDNTQSNAQSQSDIFKGTKCNNSSDSKTREKKNAYIWLVPMIVLVMAICLAVMFHIGNKQRYTLKTDEINVLEKTDERSDEKTIHNARDGANESIAEPENVTRQDSEYKLIPAILRGKWRVVQLFSDEGIDMTNTYRELNVNCYSEFTEDQHITTTMKANEINNQQSKKAYACDDLIIMPESSRVFRYRFNQDNTAVALTYNNGSRAMLVREGVDSADYAKYPDKPAYVPKELLGEWVAVATDNEHMQSGSAWAYEMGYDYYMMYSFTDTTCRTSMLLSAEEWNQFSWGTMIRMHGDGFEYFQEYEAEYTSDTIHANSRIPGRSFDIKYELKSDGTLEVEEGGVWVKFARMPQDSAKQPPLDLIASPGR